MITPLLSEVTAIRYDYVMLNRTPAIRNLPLRVTPIFANKNHALNTLKMGPFLRINVMLPQGVSG
jgi:hypothetical protein